jgi:hypothetical protein
MADSTGQRNTFAEPLSGRLEAKRLAWPLIQLSRDRIELCLRVARDVDALGKVLPEQPIRVLVTAPVATPNCSTRGHPNCSRQGRGAQRHSPHFRCCCPLAAVVGPPRRNRVRGPAVGSSSFTTTTASSTDRRLPLGQLVMGGGGYVSGVIASLTQQHLFYARTDVGGAYRWEQASSRWVPLLDVDSEDDVGLMGVESLALDTKNSAVLRRCRAAGRALGNAVPPNSWAAGRRRPGAACR